MLGLVFMVIVYFLPRGVTGVLEDGWEALGRPLDLPRGLTGPLIDAWAWLSRPFVDAWARLSRPIALPRGVAGAIEDALEKIAAARERKALTPWPRSSRREGLTKSFGGLRAVSDISLDVCARRGVGTDRSQRLGQDDAAEPHRRRDSPRRGRDPHGRRGRDAPAQSLARAQAHQSDLPARAHAGQHAGRSAR